MFKNRAKGYFFTFSLIAVVMLSGCIQKAYKPTKTSLELQAIQSTEFETSYKVAFAATLSVFQDLGYFNELSKEELNSAIPKVLMEVDKSQY